MTLGLYQVGEGQPIIRLRRGRAHEDPFARTHIAPDGSSRREALCGSRPSRGESWCWGDSDTGCPACLSRARQGLRNGSLILADPAIVAEFARQQAAAAGDHSQEARLAVEIYRPRDGVMGSVDTRREIHLIDCPIVSAVERPMVSLPVSEVRRQYNADGRRTTFCQECKPFRVLDNDRLRPRTLAEARALSEKAGCLARDQYRRRARNPHRSYAFRTLPHDGSKHFDDCPASPDELMHGDVTEPDYGRCQCYVRYETARPGERPDDDDSPEWTL